MNQKQQHPGQEATSGTPPGCFFFQTDNLLCGALNSGSSSPAVHTYGMSTADLLNAATCGGNFNQQQHNTTTSNNNKVDQQRKATAIQKSLDAKKHHFQPHMCEDQDFFVINDGSTSVDVESLSVPSMIDDRKDLTTTRSGGSESSGSIFKLDASPTRKTTTTTARNRRDSAPPSFEQDHILQAPFSEMMYRSKEEQESLVKSKSPQQPKLARKSKKSARSCKSNNKQPGLPATQIIKPIISKKEPKTHEKKPVIDEQRLRELIAPRTPPTNSTEIAATERFLQEVQTYIPSCLDKGGQQQSKDEETMVVTDPAKLFWKEKFAEAATKVIHHQSSVRCMEIVDPTIPRASDNVDRRARVSASAAAAQQHQHHLLQGRQRYRKVLKRYRKHRILVLIMDPSTKVYEMLELPFRPEETTVADVLIMARIQTTDDRLRYKEYTGLCRPNLNPPPPPPPGPPKREGVANTESSRKGQAQTRTPPQTPPRYPLAPPKVNRVTQGNTSNTKMNHLEGREDDNHTLSPELTTNTRNHTISCMLQEITVQEELVWKLLSPSRPSPPSGPAFASHLALPYVTLPLLGDIVVTVPKGYTGEEVSQNALAILQTPLFLRWVQKRYLNDLQRENDELLSRAGAAVGRSNNDRIEAMTEQQERQPPAARFQVPLRGF